MRPGWVKRRLCDVCEVQNGFAFDSAHFNGSRGLPLVRIRSLKNGVETETRYDGAYEEKYVVRAGDLLVGMDGEFGCYEWKGGPSLLNQRVCRLQNFSAQIHPRFLLYGLNDHLKVIEDATGFTTVKHLSSKTILSIEFLLPTFEEQHRIVRLLDEAFADLATARANAEKNLQNAREMFESELNDIFTLHRRGWSNVRLDDIVSADCSLSYGIVQPGDEVSEGLPIVRPTDLTDPLIGIRGLKRIDPLRARGYRRTELHGGELLLCVRGTTGIVAVASAELKGANVTRGIVPIRCNSSVLFQPLAYYAIRSRPVQDQIRRKTYGTALLQINIRDLREIELSLPPRIQQESIHKQLNALAAETRQLEALYTRKLAALDELKASLLHQAFSGQL